MERCDSNVTIFTIVLDRLVCGQGANQRIVLTAAIDRRTCVIRDRDGVTGIDQNSVISLIVIANTANWVATTGRRALDQIVIILTAGEVPTKWQKRRDLYRRFV